MVNDAIIAWRAPALTAEAEQHAAYLASLGAEVYVVADSPTALG